MPLYEITTKGEDAKRLVKAESAAQAVRHCAKEVFTARTISNVEEAADMFNAGVKIETAGVEAATEEKPKGKEHGTDGEPPEGDDAK
jgi:hypothetical protein